MNDQELNGSFINRCFPIWNRRHIFGTGNNRVHPSETTISKDSKFILIEPKIKLRVVHLKPEKVRSSCFTNSYEFDSKRNSLSEDTYWFTRTKPIRNAPCNCSFRRSFRHSLTSSTPHTKSMGINIKNVENFVEILLQETLFDAFREYLKRFSKSGIDNLAYQSTEEDFPALLRKNRDRPSVKLENEKSDQKYNSSTAIKKTCCHRHKRQKPLIMFVHGLGGTADVWNVVMRNLTCKGFETVAPDIIGHGYSSAPNKASSYHFKNLLLQAIAVFDYFMEKEDKRKCVLIGHSYGCSLVTALYPHRASKIAQLVLLSGGGPTPLAPPVELNDISPYGCASTICYPLLYCGLKRSFFYSSRGKNFKPCEDENTVPHHIMEYLLKGQIWPEGDAAFHRRIMVPTLLIYGLKDKSVTLIQECEMEKTIPRAFLELLPNAGHMSMVDSPDHITHMIRCFLDLWS